MNLGPTCRSADPLFASCSVSIPFYNVIRDYVGGFVDLHYADDDAVLADVSLRAFYTDLNDHLVNRNLPFFTGKDALSDVLATYIYYVTGCN